MRAGRGAGLVLALALCACRSREAVAPEDAGKLPAAGTLTCGALVPPEVREMVPGSVMKEERSCPTCGPLCTFRSPGPPELTVSIAYDCRPHYAETDVYALLAPTLKAGGEEVPAMGRAAARREPVPGMVQVVAWDNDTPCALVVTWLGGEAERALDLARMALFATTEERLAQPAPDAGAP